MTRARTSYGEAYWRGFERGVQAGHAAGYREGVSVLDDAADVLAGFRPSRTVEMLAARQRLAENPGTGLTPREIRARAAQSWGLPVSADLADPATPEPTTNVPAAEAAPVGAELAEDDDWAWQV